MAAGAVNVNGAVKNLTGGTVMIDGAVKNLIGGATRIDGVVKKFNFSSKNHIYIVRGYDGNATSYCRTIVNGTTYNDTNHVVVDSGTKVDFFVMSIGAMAASARIVSGDTTVQEGPGSYTIPSLDRNLLVQYARGGSGTKLYYEIYISEMPANAKGIWLFNENSDLYSMPVTEAEDEFVDICRVNLSNCGTEYNGLYIQYV